MIEVDSSQLDFITDEPVAGELLAERLARGPLTAEEALRYALEIGAILKQAHLHGRIHGALSPHSIAITGRGARILEPPASGGEQCAAYQSPEQVRGLEPDERSDIFSFGAVLYEMATGQRAFPGRGDEVALTILEATPPVPQDKPPAYAAMEAVIAACLRKRPIDRRQRIQNVVLDLRLAGRPLVVHGPARLPRARPQRGLTAPAGVPATAPRTPAPPPRWVRLNVLVWIAGIGLLAVAATAVAAILLLDGRPGPPSYAFRVDPPQNTTHPGTPAISPDGSYLTFSAVGPEGRRILWLRPLDSLRNTPIADTEGAASPFWSPDGKYIGFFANNLLKKVAASGGTPETICPTDMVAAGGTWNADGTILFAPSLNGGIYRVSASPGAKPEALLKLSPEKSEAAFRWPQFLPDQKNFVFYVQTESAKATGVYLGSVETRTYRRLFGSDTNAVYSPPSNGGPQKTGYLLFMHERNLMGQAFDAAHLSAVGDPVSLLDDIGALASMTLAPVSVSNSGILVYQAVPDATRQLVWLDREGKPLAAAKEPGEWGSPRVSPDGSRALAGRLGPDGQNADLWLLDAAGNLTQFTDTPVHEGSPVWSPDGVRAAFFEYGPTAGNFDLYAKAVSGSSKPAELLLRTAFQKQPTDWSRDGHYLLFTTISPTTKADVWALSLPDRRAGPVLGTVANEGYAALSPDGRWLAFQSDESGRAEVYVQRFDGLDWTTKRHYHVSPGGGGLPRWRADGKELYYITLGGRMMAVEVRLSTADFWSAAPKMLFQTQPLPKKWNFYDVTPDGQRFLMNLPLELTKPTSIAVVTNWTETRKRPVSSAR